MCLCMLVRVLLMIAYILVLLMLVIKFQLCMLNLQHNDRIVLIYYQLCLLIKSTVLGRLPIFISFTSLNLSLFDDPSK
jgi:hypothetical protein